MDQPTTSGMPYDTSKLPEITPSKFLIPPTKYQLMPHPDAAKHRFSCFTLDQARGVKIRAWGFNLKEAFEQCGTAVLSYMTNLPNITIKRVYAIECFGDDEVTLLETYLYDLVRLYLKRPYWLTRKVEIVEFLNHDFHLTCNCYGEFYTGYGTVHNDVPKVKNPKFSYMQVCNEPANRRFEIFVTIDPSHPNDKF